MPNSKLQNKSYIIPDNIILQLKQILDLHKDKTNEKGYDRLNFIIKNGNIKYNEMKRIKNYFDNYHGDKTDMEYTLNGGDMFKTWLNQTLEGDRNAVKGIKKDLKTMGNNNQFKKTKNNVRTVSESVKIYITESHLKNLIKKQI